MPSPADDPFAVLGLPRMFDLEAEQIRAAHLSRVAALHPDLAGGDRDAIARAARSSAELNEANATLQDPERRAAALLSLLGGPSAGDYNAMPEAFLMEMLEVRQRVEADLASGDAAARGRWRAWAEAKRSGYIEATAALFGGLGSDPEQDMLDEIRRQLNAWRYIERLIEQLDPGYDPARADFEG